MSKIESKSKTANSLTDVKLRISLDIARRRVPLNRTEVSVHKD